MKQKVLSVVAGPSERAENPSFGLVKAIENAVSSFIEADGGELESFKLEGTMIDAGAGSAADPQAVFGRTLVVVTYKPGEKSEGKGKKAKK